MSMRILGGNDLIAAVSGGVYEEVSVVEPSEEVLTFSPASIMALYLIEVESIMSQPSDRGEAGWDWPLYVSSMPDIKDDCGAIYDVPGLSDGRLMIGQVIEHQGVQIKIRSEDYQTGWEKINEIAAILDAIHNDEITIGTSSVDEIIYRIQSLTRSSEIGYLGLEPGTSRRNLFTVNYIVTIKKIE